MPLWNELQNDFSAGEVGPRLLMREDDPGHKKAVLFMENFYPTLQGTANRTPGTRYMYEIGEQENARIFPYLTPFNRNTIVEMTPHDGVTPGDIRIVDAIRDANDPTPTDLGGGTFEIWKHQVPNYQLRESFFPWDMTPDGVVIDSVGQGGELGWQLLPEGGGFGGVARDYPPGTTDLVPTCTMENSFVPPENTNEVVILLQLGYEQLSTTSPPAPPNDKDVTLEVWTGPGRTGTQIIGLESVSTTLSDLSSGERYDNLISLSNFWAGGTRYYISLSWTATAGPGSSDVSTPSFFVNNLGVLCPETVTITDTTLSAVVPYLADELDAVQYVQSPYTNSARGNPYGKQIVFTHPNYPPKELVWDGSTFAFQDIAFTNTVEFGIEWSDPKTGGTGYPAACTSHLGRLVLGGSSLEDQSANNNPKGTYTETTWSTVVGKWYEFTDITATDYVPTPADSVEATSIYRSPIKWLASQKNLLVGAEEMEYVISADGIFQPADLGVFMQSTHGSSTVQPVGLGQFVLFAAEGGRKLRAMQYVDEDQGWVAPDMGLQHPTFFDTGIRRLVRMRNPHQMVVSVRGDGQLGLLHYDTNANILGLSRYNPGDKVVDACVIPDDNGDDILYLMVRRKRLGTWRLNIEYIPLWYGSGTTFQYTNNAVVGFNSVPSPTVSGLDHLESKFVQAVGDGEYFGTFQVVGGEITLPQDVVGYAVGRASVASMTLLPLITVDPDSKKRYAGIKVRTINSSRPMINGERDNATQTAPGIPGQVDVVYDSDIANFGFDVGQQITISENEPIRTEILGVWGKVRGSAA